MRQIQPDDLKGISQTLLIPLHYYVEESKSQSSSFKDEIARDSTMASLTTGPSSTLAQRTTGRRHWPQPPFTREGRSSTNK